MFPKKYINKNKNIQRSSFPSSKFIYSRALSADQKVHPGALFLIFMKDYISKMSLWGSDGLDFDINFALSSNWYSKLNRNNVNLKQLQLDLKKQVKQNIKFLEKLGFSFFINENHFVVDEKFYIFLREVFVNLYKDWKIHLEKKVVSRSKELQTNVLKTNLFIKKKKKKEFVIKYFIESKWVSISVPTKNLKTIFADVAVAVNPQDKRYKKLIWQNVIIPIINKNIPIIWDDSVVSFEWTWVVRITPWHDEYGLEIAQKHNLPTNIYAIDVDGNFTKHVGDFVGKPVDVFIENVETYINDIWNLEQINETEEELMYCAKSGEELYKITMDQWGIKYDYSLDFLLQNFETKDITIKWFDVENHILDYLKDLNFVNISNKSAKGTLIPVLYSEKWQKYLINDDVLVEQYKIAKSRKDLTLTAVILNLVLDNQLNDVFSIEELVDVLFSFDFSGGVSKLSKYIDIYENTERSSLKNWLKGIKRLLWKIERDSEKIMILLELLRDSFAIKSDWERFSLDFSAIFWSQEPLVLQKQDSFNKDFLDTVWLLFKNNLWKSMEGYSGIKNLWNIFIWTKDDKEFFVNLLLLWLDYSKTLFFSDSLFIPYLTDQESNIITNYNSKFLTKELSGILDLFNSDLLRLLLLLWQKENNKVILDTNNIEYIHFMLNKVWNAYRYVYNNYINWISKINIKELFNLIEQDISDYDNWILHWLKSLLEELKNKNKNILDFGSKILKFIINDLCENYLESTKIYEYESTPHVALFSFIVSLEILRPLMPLFMQEIEKLFFNKLKISNFDISTIWDFNLKEKNYRMNIFMDIVDKLKKIKQNLWVKKHETVDVFVQANLEFINFLSEREDLLEALLNIRNIVYVKDYEKTPSDYEMDNVIDINIWAKSVSEQIGVTKNVLMEMEEDLKNKQEYLQHMKSLISSILSTASMEIIEKKKQDIQNLQKEVEELEFKINKMKIKG